MKEEDRSKLFIYSKSVSQIPCFDIYKHSLEWGILSHSTSSKHMTDN